MPGTVEEVVSHVKKVRSQGAGVISMKLVGEGKFTRAKTRRPHSILYSASRRALRTIGYKNTAGIDEAMSVSTRR